MKSAPNSVATAFVFCGERPTTTTFSPLLRSLFAAAAPRPSLAPVMTMVRPATEYPFRCPLHKRPGETEPSEAGSPHAARQRRWRSILRFPVADEWELSLLISIRSLALCASDGRDRDTHQLGGTRQLLLPRKTGIPLSRSASRRHERR